jgi:hypothetical protein
MSHQIGSNDWKRLASNSNYHLRYESMLQEQQKRAPRLKTLYLSLIDILGPFILDSKRTHRSLYLIPTHFISILFLRCPLLIADRRLSKEVSAMAERIARSLVKKSFKKNSNIVVSSKCIHDIQRNIWYAVATILALSRLQPGICSC